MCIMMQFLSLFGIRKATKHLFIAANTSGHRNDIFLWLIPYYWDQFFHWGQWQVVQSCVLSPHVYNEWPPVLAASDKWCCFFLIKKIVWFFIIYFFIGFLHSLSKYSETCLIQTSLEPTFVFGIDRCSIYTVILTKLSLYRIPFYSVLDLYRFHYIF
jgi:hypothetical protein